MASTTLSVSSPSISGSTTPCLPNNTAATVAHFKPRTRTFSTFLLGQSLSLYRTSRIRPIGSKNASNGITCQASSSVLPSALLFDCDGVLVDTEKDGHRISFNETFDEKELGVTWDVDLYGELLKIGGGKERMTAYFNKVGWPEKAPKNEDERKAFIAGLHKRKTDLFMALIEKQLLPLRPGVAKSVTLLTPLTSMLIVIMRQLGNAEP